jgi:hypothetical protein
VETFPPPVLKNTPLIFPERSKDVPVAAPMFGVTSVGDVESTTFPVPVLAVTPVPPLATDRVPVVPATIGNPVAFVS